MSFTGSRRPVASGRPRGATPRRGLAPNLRSPADSGGTRGEIDGFALFSEITDRKEKERELRRQNERLEEFANIVSHDLHNPLNVAMGHLEIVRVQHDSPSVEHVAEDGPGIPPEHRDSVFETGHTTSEGGTGFEPVSKS